MEEGTNFSTVEGISKFVNLRKIPIIVDVDTEPLIIFILCFDKDYGFLQNAITTYGVLGVNYSITSVPHTQNRCDQAYLLEWSNRKRGV